MVVDELEALFFCGREECDDKMSDAAGVVDVKRTDAPIFFVPVYVIERNVIGVAEMLGAILR
jgi:hypothetical protein